MATRRVLDDMGGLPRSIGGETVLKGQLRGSDNYLIHGKVLGHANVTGVLLIATDCEWQGNLQADVVVVKGRVEGNITALSKIELRDSARVKGRLSAPSIAIGHGAKVDGPIDQTSMVTHFHERRVH